MEEPALEGTGKACLLNRMFMNAIKILLTLCLWQSAALIPTASQVTLAERLGFKPTDRILIINGDDVGMCHTANLATIEAMERGLMKSGTIMVPCPWFSEIAEYARRHPQSDFGVHLCHTSEWKYYRWGPVAAPDKVRGLMDPDGCLWRSVEEVYAHATPEEALEEGRAQIRKALAAGIDVTHLDSHMGTLQLDPRFMESYFKLALEFDLPARMASQETLVKFSQPHLRNDSPPTESSFPITLSMRSLRKKKWSQSFWADVLKSLKPGVTELYIHAGKPTDELKAITGSWATRSEEFETFTNDPEIRRIIAEPKSS